MAQTTQKQGSRSRSASRNGSKARSNGSRSNGSRATSASNKRRSSPKPKGVRGRAAEAVKTVKSKGPEKAKTPLIAGGSALAGLAGGAVLARGQAGRKLTPLRGGTSTAKALGMVAKEVGRAGYQVGQLTSEVQKIRQATKNG